MVPGLSFIARRVTPCVLAGLMLTKNGPKPFLVIANPVAAQGSPVHVVAWSYSICSNFCSLSSVEFLWHLEKLERLKRSFQEEQKEL